MMRRAVLVTPPLMTWSPSILMSTAVTPLACPRRTIDCLLSQTDVNWLDEVFSDNALLQNYELSVSGATEKTNYYVSGGYYDQEGIAPGSDFSRYSLRANIEQRAAKWLKVGTNTLLNYQQIELAQSVH